MSKLNAEAHRQIILALVEDARLQWLANDGCGKDWDSFVDLYSRVHLRDGGTVHESMETAIAMMVEIACEMYANGVN